WGSRLLDYGSLWNISHEDIWPIVYHEHGACDTDFAFPYTLPHDRFPRSPRISHDRFTCSSVHFSHPHVLLSLSRFILHDTSEERRPRDGWLTVHWPAVPPAFLALPSVTVDELQRLVLS